MAGDILCGIEILCEQRRRHHQSGAGIGKAFARRAIDGKFLRGIERRNTREIADGVGVFPVRQTPQPHRPRIPRAGQRDAIQRALHPVREELHLLGRRPRLVLRRHLFVANLIQGVLPNQGVAFHESQRGKAFQIEIALLLLRGVASDAVFLQHRLNGMAKHLFIRSSCAENQRRDDAQIRRELHAMILRRTSPQTSVRRSSRPALR